MQLDPNAFLVEQVRNVSSTALERLTAATFASVGYTVFRNLRIEFEGQPGADADVFVSVFSPLRESRLLFECKGGTPTPNDIRKFASFRELLSPTAPDELVMMCKENIPVAQQEIASQLRIRLVEKNNLIHYVLPMLSGASLRQARARELNRYLAWQVLHEYFIDQTSKHPQLKQHYRFLACELWKIGEPELQAGASFEAYTQTYAGTSDSVAAHHNTTALAALYDPVHDDIEASLYVMALHRVMNVWAIVRWTIRLMQTNDSVALISRFGKSLRDAITLLAQKPRYIFAFPAFLQTFLFVWGGFLVDSNRKWEIQQLANESGTTFEAVEHHLRVFDLIYAGSLTGVAQGLSFFKYMPAACRALGAHHRRTLNPAAYGEQSFFGQQGPRYDAVLNRSLSTIGGVSGLRF